MSYVAAAYGITAVSLAWYAIALLRERGRLSRDADRDYNGVAQPRPQNNG